MIREKKIKFLAGMLIVLSLFLTQFLTSGANAAQRVGVLYDSVLTETSPYSVYSSTPGFLAQDILDSLSKNGAFEAIPLSEMRAKLKKENLTHKDIAALRNIKYGYDLDFTFLKKVSKALGTNNLVLVAQSMEMERDFLKNTLWNTLNIGGMDTVNPTHRVTIYAALVDTNKETVLWEELYAKNIRNNKFKNLDAETAGNWEGMMRLKQYSKYVSPEIASNVTLALAPAAYKPEAYLNKFENVALQANKKVRIGSNKKLRADNEAIRQVFIYEQKAVDATKDGYKKVKAKFQKAETPDVPEL